MILVRQPPGEPRAEPPRTMECALAVKNVSRGGLPRVLPTGLSCSVLK
jgi:hypothetical protein